MKHALAIAFVLALVACGGSAKQTPDTTANDDPDRKLTRDECKKAFDHVMTFPTAGTQMSAESVQELKAHEDWQLDDCQSKATKADYRCEMAARSWADLHECRRVQTRPAPGDDEPRQ